MLCRTLAVIIKLMGRYGCELGTVAQQVLFYWLMLLELVNVIFIRSSLVSKKLLLFRNTQLLLFVASSKQFIFVFNLFLGKVRLNVRLDGSIE